MTTQRAAGLFGPMSIGLACRPTFIRRSCRAGTGCHAEKNYGAGADGDRTSAHAGDCSQTTNGSAPPRMRPAQFLKRVFDNYIGRCPKCGGQLKLIATIEEPAANVRIFSYPGLAAPPPLRAPAARVDLLRWHTYLTSGVSSDTFRILEKGRLKFLYPRMFRQQFREQRAGTMIHHLHRSHDYGFALWGHHLRIVSTCPIGERFPVFLPGYARQYLRLNVINKSNRVTIRPTEN